jgi:predicted TIM-barrel fold metal-dependent hydrolase
VIDLSGLSLVDGHCHPLLPDPWDVSPAATLDLFTEGRPGAMAAHAPHTGYFRRAVTDLARRLGTEPTLPAILEGRRAAGIEAARRWLVESQVEALLVDTGYPPGAMTLDRMAQLLPCAVHEIFRSETCAERLLGWRLSFPAFLAAYRDELTAAAQRAVALKTIVAYRSGLAVREWPHAEAVASYRSVIARLDAGGTSRLTEKPLLDTLFRVTLEVAREAGRPVQIHTGFGDPDIDLLQANPLLLRPILEDERWAGVRLVLLHTAYPYFREAAFMTAVWPQVHLDLSLALPFLGAGAVGPLVEVLSLAPSSKLLYGSDVRALPELFALSADWARATLGEALGWLAARGDLTQASARRIGEQVLATNVRSLYGLPAAASGDEDHSSSPEAGPGAPV